MPSRFQYDYVMIKDILKLITTSQKLRGCQPMSTSRQTKTSTGLVGGDIKATDSPPLSQTWSMILTLSVLGLMQCHQTESSTKNLLFTTPGSLYENILSFVPSVKGFLANSIPPIHPSALTERVAHTKITLTHGKQASENDERMLLTSHSNPTVNVPFSLFPDSKPICYSEKKRSRCPRRADPELGRSIKSYDRNPSHESIQDSPSLFLHARFFTFSPPSWQAAVMSDQGALRSSWYACLLIQAYPVRFVRLHGILG